MNVSGSEDVRTLWADHERVAFPTRLRGEDIAGIDVVMLDADVAGCVVTWLGADTPLDSGRRVNLSRCVHDLDAVVDALTNPSERAYFERLRSLAQRILASRP